MHFAATEADASKATRPPTMYRAKEMGVVRQAKEMASQKVGEIPVSSKRHSVLPGLCVVMLCFYMSHCRVEQLLRSLTRWNLMDATEYIWLLHLLVGPRLPLVTELYF